MIRMDYPRLPRQWKNHYPFRLACPSFVYPADYDANVDLLGPHVDEIELLFFESRPDVPITEDLIRRLVVLGQHHSVGYHVHLPTDLALFDADAGRRQAAIAAIEDLTHLTAPLEPAFFILHLEMAADQKTVAGKRRCWERRVMQGLEQISSSSLKMPRLRIENQSVPLDWLEPVLEAFDLTLCLDIGHLKLAGEKLADAFSRWAARISGLHVHGVLNGRDHCSLKCLSRDDQRALVSFLRSFRGSVCVEIFEFDPLCESLQLLAQWLDLP